MPMQKMSTNLLVGVSVVFGVQVLDQNQILDYFSKYGQSQSE